MTLEKAIRLARKWAAGHVCTLKEGEAQEYHQMCAEALEKSRWISVEERLPECGTVALVWDGTFRNVARLGKWGWHMEYLPDGRDGGKFVDGVTHWMPLPEPPEVEV